MKPFGLKCRSMIWNPWVQGSQAGERLHELSMLSISSSLMDARHALKLCEMSRVVLRVRMEVFFFLAALCRDCRSVISITVETLVSLLQAPRSAARTSSVRVRCGAFIRVRHEGWSNIFVRLPCTSRR